MDEIRDDIQEKNEARRRIRELLRSRLETQTTTLRTEHGRFIVVRRDEVRELLSMMRPRQRDVVMMRYERGKSVDEVCELFQCSRKTVERDVNEFYDAVFKYAVAKIEERESTRMGNSSGTHPGRFHRPVGHAVTA